MDEPNAPPPPDAAAQPVSAPASEADAAPAPAAQQPSAEVAPASSEPPSGVPEPVVADVAAPTPPPVDAATRAVSGVTRQATTLALALCVATVVGTALAQREGAPDLAAKKPWRASSKYADCHPERFDCGGAKTGIFFHTNMEPNPWVEIDLLAPTAFSAVSVRNRSDGFQERAVPLVLEVSDDRSTWRELARRDDTFQRWAPTFEKTTARYVRLRVLRPSFLHLDSFKVHP